MSRNIAIILRPAGGIRTYCKYLYNSMDMRDYNVTFMMPDWKESKRLCNDLYYRNPHFRYKYLKSVSPYFKLNPKQIALEILRNKFDIVHAHGFTAGLSSAVPSLMTNTSLLVTGHNCFHPDDFSGYIGKLRRNVMAIMFNSINTFHCVSEDAAENLSRYFPSIMDKIKLIEHGIEITSFIQHNARNLRSEHNIPANVFLIGYFGRYMPEKGFIYLIEAIEQLNRRNLCKALHVICWGEGGYLKEYKNIIFTKGLMDYFIFVPFEDNIGASLKELDVVVIPSLLESCCLLAIETLISGTPLIATDCIGLRGTVAATAATVIPAGNSLALANALEREMNNSTRQMVFDNRDSLIKRFDIIRVSDAMSTLYNELANRRNRKNAEHG